MLFNFFHYFVWNLYSKILLPLFNQLEPLIGYLTRSTIHILYWWFRTIGWIWFRRVHTVKQWSVIGVIVFEPREKLAVCFRHVWYPSSTSQRPSQILWFWTVWEETPITHSLWSERYIWYWILHIHLMHLIIWHSVCSIHHLGGVGTVQLSINYLDWILCRLFKYSWIFISV